MKFDGKQIKVSNVNVVTAPRTQNKNLVPIIVVVILALVLVGISVYIFFFSGLFKKPMSITFNKPIEWSETVYAIYYKDQDEVRTLNDNVLKNKTKKEEYKMTGDAATGVYSIKIDEKYKDGYVVFIDSKNNAYPEDAISKIEKGQIVGEKIVNGKTYGVSETSKTSSQTSKTSSAASK